MVLENVNFIVNEGEFICVIGYFGCGKLILFNMVFGFVSFIDGFVQVGGKIIIEFGFDCMVVF